MPRSPAAGAPEIWPSLIETWHRIGDTRCGERIYRDLIREIVIAGSRVSSRTPRFPRRGKRTAEELCFRARHRSIVETSDFRDLKTSCSKIRLLGRKAREGSRHGNGGASSDWYSREEIASRLVIITTLTQLPLPPIVLPIIFVIELLATKSPSILFSAPSRSFVRHSFAYLAAPATLSHAPLSSTPISFRASACSVEFWQPAGENERGLSLIIDSLALS